MQPKYTAEQWDQVYPALRSFAVITVDMARAVLVEGKRPVDVATEFGQTRQSVNEAVKRVRTRFEKQEIAGLVPVNVWLPQHLAEQVLEMAKPYMTEAAPAVRRAPRKAKKTETEE